MIKNDRFRILKDNEKTQYKFSLCELCNFYECELTKEYMLFRENNPAEDGAVPSLTYNPSELERGCPMQHFIQVECARKNVADGIGDDFKANIRDNFKIESEEDGYRPVRPGKWEPKQPVFISAQTGQGKNYFIENILLPYVRDMNIERKADQKVLIISNRIALKLQIKNRLGQGTNYQETDSFENYKGYPADVMTYQGILNKIEYLKKKQKNRHSSYTFIVCDEAHFFTSDAMFNHDTEKILSAIVTTFQDAIRIYMSATPYEALEHIEQCESKPGTDRYVGVFYHFKRDYNYLDIKYYSDHDELADLIVDASTKGEKWLVFIDDIKMGNAFKDKLEAYPDMKGKVFAVNAKCKDNGVYQEILKKEDLGDKLNVLITTSVLDNGVNFRGIQNVVISDIDKVKCLQMVGRARVSGDNRITLYIKKFKEKCMELRINRLKDQQDAYHAYDLMVTQRESYNGYKDKFYDKYIRGNETDWKNANHWFGYIKQDQLSQFQNERHPNEIARLLVGRLLERYSAILEEMQRIDRKQEADSRRKVTGQRYLEHQLSWFGKEYHDMNDITLGGEIKAKEELINYLELYAVAGTQIFKDEQGEDNGKENFSKEFTRLCDKVFGRQDKNKGRIYGLDKIRKILEKYDLKYQLVDGRSTGGSKQTYWIVQKLDSEGLSDRLASE